MTEKNIFCYSKCYEDENSFQQVPFRAFNKTVWGGRYNEIEKEVSSILNDWKGEWETVTIEQWKKLLAIPEAKGFKKGLEFISDININLKND